MDRKEELVKLFESVDSKDLIIRSIDEMLFLENQLEALRQVPHIKFHPTNPELQKRTEAGKLYKEYLQQYNNIVKTLCSILNKNDVEVEDSPLRAYFKRMNKNDN